MVGTLSRPLSRRFYTYTLILWFYYVSICFSRNIVVLFVKKIGFLHTCIDSQAHIMSDMVFLHHLSGILFHCIFQFLLQPFPLVFEPVVYLQHKGVAHTVTVPISEVLVCQTPFVPSVLQICHTEPHSQYIRRMDRSGIAYT